jgi:hypothetical protein
LTASTITRASCDGEVTRIGVAGGHLLQGVDDVGHLPVALGHVENDQGKDLFLHAFARVQHRGRQAQGELLGQGVGKGRHVFPDFADDEDSGGHDRESAYSA